MLALSTLKKASTIFKINDKGSSNASPNPFANGPKPAINTDSLPPAAPLAFIFSAWSFIALFASSTLCLKIPEFIPSLDINPSRPPIIAPPTPMSLLISFWCSFCSSIFPFRSFKAFPWCRKSANAAFCSSVKFLEACNEANAVVSCSSDKVPPLLTISTCSLIALRSS